MSGLARKFDRLVGLAIDSLGAVSGAVVAFITLAISTDVVLRALGQSTLGWTLEASEYGLLIVCFLGAPFVLRHGDHIRVDVLLRQVAPRRRGAMLIFANLVALVTCLVLAWLGTQEALVAFRRGAMLFKDIVMPQWIVLSIMPVGMLLLAWEFARRIALRLKGTPVGGEGTEGVAL